MNCLTDLLEIELWFLSMADCFFCFVIISDADLVDLKNGKHYGIREGRHYSFFIIMFELSKLGIIQFDRNFSSRISRNLN